MRLVSLNSWKAEGNYPARLRAMVEGLAALAPDVVALQEDLRTWDGQTHTARTLARALGMQLSWVPARAKPRKLGPRRVMSTAGLAVLSRAPVLEQRVLNLPQDDRDGERLAQCLRFRGNAGDWWLVNLHLCHLPDRADLRRAQLAHVLAALDTWAPVRRTVLCGDFNAEPDDPEMAASLWPNGPLSDAFAGRSKVTLRTGTGPGLNLDHILLRAKRGAGALEVSHAGVALDQPDAHGTLPSDHFAVFADLML
jgi:endonuclease/exonuclease/phosphatase family metal-dependent hydrolase